MSESDLCEIESYTGIHVKNVSLEGNNNSYVPHFDKENYEITIVQDMEHDIYTQAYIDTRFLEKPLPYVEDTSQLKLCFEVYQHQKNGERQTLNQITFDTKKEEFIFNVTPSHSKNTKV